MREAATLLRALYRLLNCERHHYRRDDRSPAKAVWLLHMDALDGIFDSLENLTAKRPRVAALIFRAIEESLDLATLFASGSAVAATLLGRWFDNEIVPHSKYREYLREVEGPEAAEERTTRYRNLSKFTHRTYRAITDTYSLGGGDRLVHERTAMLYSDSPESASTLVLPHTMAAYYAVLASLIIAFTEQIDMHQLVPSVDLEKAILASLEEDTVPRRFMPSRWLRFFDPGLKAVLRAASERAAGDMGNTVDQRQGHQGG